MAELSLLQAISTGGNVAVFALLALHWKQSQAINQLKLEITKLETKLEFCNARGCSK